SILSIFGLLLAILGVLLVPTPENTQVHGAIHALTMFLLILFLACAVFGIFTGVGLLRLRNWARISAMVGSGIVLFFCTFLLLIFVFVPLPVPPDSPALTIYIIRGTMLRFYHRSLGRTDAGVFIR